MKTYIVGHGGFAREVYATFSFPGSFGGFVGTDINDIGKIIMGDARITTTDEYLIHGNSSAQYLVAIANPKIRMSIADTFTKSNNCLVPALPSVAINTTRGPFVKIGDGSIVMGSNILTTCIAVGKHTIINVNNVVGHDAIIGDYVTIAPGCNIAGGVFIDNGCTLGMGAIILEGISIGAGSYVGAGAVVTKDVAPGVVVAGVPATFMRDA